MLCGLHALINVSVNESLYGNWVADTMHVCELSDRVGPGLGSWDMGINEDFTLKTGQHLQKTSNV